MKVVSSCPLVIIGPSGAGKSTAAERLAKLPFIEVLPTVTTRPVRLQENTHTHVFVDQVTFNAMQKRGDFIGTTHLFGYDYGLPKLPSTEKQLVIMLRASFVSLFKIHYPNSLIVQLEAPLPILKSRLTRRGDRDRVDETVLEKEIALGRSVADVVLSTDRPIDTYTDAIIARLTRE